MLHKDKVQAPQEVQALVEAPLEEAPLEEAISILTKSLLLSKISTLMVKGGILKKPFNGLCNNSSQMELMDHSKQLPKKSKKH
jgi:hypothetical protein